MADSYNKKERDKKRKKRKQDKAEKKKLRKLEGVKPQEFMYVDEDGNLTPTPPDPTKKKEFKLEEINVSTPKASDIVDDPIKDGYIKFFNTEKRFGFIVEEKTGDEYFVHEENLLDKVVEKDKVQFELGNGHKGIVAMNVKLKKEKKEKKAE